MSDFFSRCGDTLLLLFFWCEHDLVQPSTSNNHTEAQRADFSHWQPYFPTIRHNESLLLHSKDIMMKESAAASCAAAHQNEGGTTTNTSGYNNNNSYWRPSLRHQDSSSAAGVAECEEKEGSTSSSSLLHALFDHVPSTYGLLITFASGNANAAAAAGTTTTTCRMELVPDQHLSTIHPNAHGPASLQNLQTLKGGGSGVSVFSGTMMTEAEKDENDLGDVVMKHGGFRDTQELFALATIAQELQKRGGKLRRRSIKDCDDDDDDVIDPCCHDMLSRLPEFKMLYLSPAHLKDKPKYLWKTLYQAVTAIRHADDKQTDTTTAATTSSTTTNSSSGEDWNSSSSSSHPPPPTSEETSNTTVTGGSELSADERGGLTLFGKQICLYTTTKEHVDEEHANVHIHVRPNKVEFILGSNDTVHVDRNNGNDQQRHYALDYGKSVGGDDDDTSSATPENDSSNDGYYRLKTFIDKLVSKQKRYLWKFTQGQKRIGGPSPRTAFSYLAQGTLESCALHTLIDQYLQVIHNLQHLTLPEEKNVIDKIRKEVDAIETDAFFQPCDVSNDLDAFVGFALKKNFDPDKGRFHVLRRMGQNFRDNTEYTLTDPEVLPGRLLGKLLQEGTQINEIFDGSDGTMHYCALDLHCTSTPRSTSDSCWRRLIRQAISVQSPNGLERIWNCGLIDGGLHNLFLGTEKVWFFDLGEPTLQPLPAFMTKFLFSFLHALGMVDDKSSNDGSWVNRFESSSNDGGNKIALTSETQVLVTKAYGAFKITLDRLMEALFDGDDAVRTLLLSYVSFQLLSDAAFCLNKWSIKGGGRSRGSNHQTNLEKWLWRALWDLYIASDLNTEKRLQFLGVPSIIS